MSTKNFINEAFTLLEESEDIILDDEIEVEPAEDVEDEVIEVEEVPEDEPTLDNLEDRIERLEDAVYGDDVPSEDVSGEEESFDNKVRKDFMRVSKIPEETEITEELLDKTACKKAYIPQVAVRNHISNEQVKNIMLGR